MISVEIAREMMVLLQAVVQHGTGFAAASLKHPLGGKTGTTNGFTDAWFVGFSPSVTCGTWIGFDDRQTLGSGEQGAKAALPMWMDFMRAADAGKDDEAFPTADAPKKKLDVSLNANKNTEGSDKPAKSDDDAPADPDDPDASAGKVTPSPDVTPTPVTPPTKPEGVTPPLSAKPVVVPPAF